jgi:hypothetical protein
LESTGGSLLPSAEERNAKASKSVKSLKVEKDQFDALMARLIATPASAKDERQSLGLRG